MEASAASAATGATVLPLYGSAHLVVDACCAAVVFGVLATQTVPAEAFAALLLLYHVIAFGLQPVLGLLVDATRTPRSAALVGCMVCAGALLIPMPIVAIVVTSLGNALFHVGGGVVSLQITPHRATAPGLFVAPGSLGLLLGAILGKSGLAVAGPLLASALVLCILLAGTPVPQAETVTRPKRLPSRAELVIGLILLSISVRSLLGFLVSFPWETQPWALLALTAATFFGKALGGILADRWGWIRVAVGSMLAALPFLADSSMFPLAVIPGLFLLNMTMPITLVAVAETLPGRPGFAFGLTTLALLLGAIPFFLGAAVSGPIFVCFVVLLSLAGLYRGLQLLSSDQSLREAVEA
jgi:MFS transporter, FSR family, fosmidomycin resistance protein